MSIRRSRADRRPAGPFEFGIEKAEIEHRIVGDQRRVAEESDELVGHVGEQRLVLEEVVAQAVDRESLAPACRARGLK